MTTTKAKRVALYLRTSTDKQTTENQRLALTKVARQRGWKVVETYDDNGVSGAKGREERPAFDAMCRDMTAGKFDVVMAWAVDRLGRSLQHLIGFLEELKAARCDLFLHQQSLDTTTPAGRAMFQMIGVFAEFERSMIRERVVAGIERAREHGTKTGKPFGRPVTKPKVEDKIRELRREGKGMLKIARELGVGVSVVQRVTANMAEAVPAAS